MEEKDIVNFDIDIDVDSIDYSNSEIKDERITELIDKCVTIRTKKGVPKDINIDFLTLLNISDEKRKNQFERIKPINIETRKVNGTKYFSFFKDFKVIMSYMTEIEIEQMLALRVMYEKYSSLTKTRINEIIDNAIRIFVPFINRFINYVDPIAYTPKCRTVEKDSLKELYFSEDHLKYLLKLIILSKITLIFTDCVDNSKDKQDRSNAKKELAKKIWNTIFVEGDKKVNMRNKIHKLINSRFISTMHNEKRFWDAAEFDNINIYSQANHLYNDLQTVSILMLQIDRNPISFLDVFLKNTIHFLTKRKFKLEFVLNSFDTQTSTMNSELTTEIKISIYDDILMKKTIDTFIKKNVIPLISNNCEIAEKFEKYFHKNILHFWIVIPIISKMLNISPLYLTAIEKEKFIQLTIYVYYKLISIKCFSIAELLMSNMKEIKTGVYNDDVKQTSLQIAKYLKSDDLSNFLDSKKLNNNMNDITKVISNPLICMLMNQYYSFENDIKIDLSMNDVISEYVRFLDYFVSL